MNDKITLEEALSLAIRRYGNPTKDEPWQRSLLRYARELHYAGLKEEALKLVEAAAKAKDGPTRATKLLELTLRPNKNHFEPLYASPREIRMAFEDAWTEVNAL